MKPTISNLLFVFIFIFVLRFVVLDFFPTIIVNGYFSIFLCFFIITHIFTNNIIFSIIIGLLAVNFRIIYRTVKDKKTLSKYNSFSNCLMFTIALFLLSIILINFERIHKTVNKYYDYATMGLILINLYSLQINETDSQLVCFS